MTKSTAKAKAAAKQSAPSAQLIVLGYDEHHKPQGAQFPAADAELVTKAVQLMDLKVYTAASHCLCEGPARSRRRAAALISRSGIQPFPPTWRVMWPTRSLAFGISGHSRHWRTHQDFAVARIEKPQDPMSRCAQVLDEACPCAPRNAFFAGRAVHPLQLGARMVDAVRQVVASRRFSLGFARVEQQFFHRRNRRACLARIDLGEPMARRQHALGDGEQFAAIIRRLRVGYRLRGATAMFFEHAIVAGLMTNASVGVPANLLAGFVGACRVCAPCALFLLPQTLIENAVEPRCRIVQAAAVLSLPSSRSVRPS